MANTNLLEGVTISITSIVIVFLVLFGLQMILVSFKYIFKEEILIEKVEKNLPVINNSLEADEETKTVASGVLLQCFG